MNERRWEQLGAAAGVGFVIALLLSFFIVPTPPHIDASTAKIAKWFTDNRTRQLWSAMLVLPAVVLFLWFLGHLRHVLNRAEGGVEALSPLVFGSGLVLAGIGLVGCIPLGTMAFMADRPDVMRDAVFVRTLWDMNAVIGFAIAAAAGLFAAVTGYAMLRKELVLPVLGWLGLAVAAVNWVGAGVGFFNASYSSFWTVWGVIGILGFALFILLTSASMLTRPETERVTMHRPVFAH